MEEIFYTCQIANRSFTWPQWCQFIDNKESENPAYIDGCFVWNIHDVCTNPNSFSLEGCEKESIEVRTARAKGKWFFGVTYNNKDGFSSSPCCYNEFNFFNSEQAAILAALKKLKALKMSKAMRQAINGKMFDQRQLTLF